MQRAEQTRRESSLPQFVISRLSVQVRPSAPLLSAQRQGVTQEASVTPFCVSGKASHKASHTPFLAGGFHGHTASGTITPDSATVSSVPGIVRRANGQGPQEGGWGNRSTHHPLPRQSGKGATRWSELPLFSRVVRQYGRRPKYGVLSSVLIAFCAREKQKGQRVTQPNCMFLPLYELNGGKWRVCRNGSLRNYRKISPVDGFV